LLFLILTRVFDAIVTLYSFIAIPIGYLLGSIPFSYIVARLFGKIDLRTEGDGRISAAAVRKRMGTTPFLVVVVLDVCKGFASVLIAKALVNSSTVEDLPMISLLIVLGTGFVAVIGHSWSPFIKFQGGLGATVIYGALAGAFLWPQEAIALVAGGIAVIITKKSGFSTGVIIVTLVIILLLQKLFWTPDMSWLAVVYPLILILLMVAKRSQVRRKGDFKSTELLENWKENT
jgi:glycerol-3-phosphate acyltransferase PlsY